MRELLRPLAGLTDVMWAAVGFGSAYKLPLPASFSVDQIGVMVPIA
jgi:hypothetical protein